MIVFKLIICVVILIIIVAFSVENLQGIDLKYYNYYLELKTISAPLMIVLLISLFSGFFLASLFGLVSNIRFKNIIRKRNQTIKNLDKEIAKLTLNSSTLTDDKN